MHKMMNNIKSLVAALSILLFPLEAHSASMKFKENFAKLRVSNDECKNVFMNGKQINFSDPHNRRIDIWYMHDWKVYAFWIDNTEFHCDLRGYYE